MPEERSSLTWHIRIESATIGRFSVYVTAGMYEDGTVGEIFCKGAGKEGSTTQGLLDGFATLWSVVLQHGASLDSLVRKFSGTRFEPYGPTDDPEVPYATSLFDYIARRLAMTFGDDELKVYARDAVGT